MIAAVLAVLVALAAPAPADPFPSPAAGRTVMAGSATDDAEAIIRSRALMGTLGTVRLERGALAPGSAAALANRALDEIARLDPLLSSWDGASELSRMNAGAAAGRFACSPDLFGVVRRGLDLAAATGGAFDPSVEPLARAWDLRGAGRVPTRDELDSALALVGYAGVRCDESDRTVRFARPGMGLDLGGIGKGWALDRAAEVIRRAAPAAARVRGLINLGGEIRVVGSGAPVEIELAHPGDRLRPVAHLAVDGGAVSTSGQGERTLHAGGHPIGHVLDPRTGEPLPTRASVTVIAADATTADALSTGLLVMGREAAGRWAELHPEFGVVWLEPSQEEVRGWRWNHDCRAIESEAVRWMN